jgi:hypothetical protein
VCQTVLIAEAVIAKRVFIEIKSLSDVPTIRARGKGFELDQASMRKMTVIMSTMV